LGVVDGKDEKNERNEGEEYENEEEGVVSWEGSEKP
jgi:hypothetical protein